MAVQAMYALKPTPCSLLGSFILRGGGMFIMDVIVKVAVGYIACTNERCVKRTLPSSLISRGDGGLIMDDTMKDPKGMEKHFSCCRGDIAKLCFPLPFAWLLFLLFVLFPVHAATLKGQRLKVTGRWNGTELLIYKVKFRDARKDPRRGQVAGIIDQVDLEARLLQIGPLRIHWYQSTRFNQIRESDLKTGLSVKVNVRITRTGELIAREIQPGPADITPDELKLLGVVTLAEPLPEDLNRIVILGVAGLVSERLANPILQLTRRQDDARPEDQLRVDLFDRPLVIGGEFGLTPRFEKDFKLDPEEEDDRLRLNTQLQLELFYSPSRMVAIFLEGQADAKMELYREGGRDKTVEYRFRRGETWLFWGDIFQSGVSLQVGRQNFQDRREWWWDVNIDALRLYFTRPFFHFEAGVGKEVFKVSSLEDDIDPEQDDVLRVLSKVRWEWNSDHALSLFFLHQFDSSGQDPVGKQVDETEVDESDVRLTWGGIRATGGMDVGDSLDLEYWLDTALMGGRETLTEFDSTDNDSVKEVESIRRRDLFGGAVDVGLILETDLPFRPTFTVSYAYGSREFRQTGLQDNNVRFRGVDRFRLYGELLRPELANLHIWTAAMGFPLFQSSSIEVLYHKYLQASPQPFLRNARLKADPEGEDRDIGHEMNVVIGLEEWKRLELEFVFGMFWAGKAFGDLEGRTAWNTILKMNYNF